MINKDRIVPVTATDLISLYSTIIVQQNSSVKPIDAIDVEGDFSLEGVTDNTLIASQPVKRLDVPSDASSTSFYFVADYEFEGIFINGVEVPVTVVTMGGYTTNEDIKNDGCTLYLAQFSGSSTSMNVKKVGF